MPNKHGLSLLVLVVVASEGHRRDDCDGLGLLVPVLLGDSISVPFQQLYVIKEIAEPQRGESSVLRPYRELHAELRR